VLLDQIALLALEVGTAGNPDKAAAVTARIHPRIAALTERMAEGWRATGPTASGPIFLAISMPAIGAISNDAGQASY
jgi:hypothetical protein